MILLIYSMMGGYTYNSSRRGTQVHLHVLKISLQNVKIMSPIGMHYWISLVGQTLPWDERVWSSSHHCLVPNTPRISWHVNWLSDKWRCGGCLFWLVTWGAGVINEILALQNMSQFMFTPTSLGAMLSSTQHRSLMGMILTRLSPLTWDSGLWDYYWIALFHAFRTPWQINVSNQELNLVTPTFSSLLISLDTYWCVALHQLPVPIHFQVFALTSHWTIKAPNHDREQEEVEKNQPWEPRVNAWMGCGNKPRSKEIPPTLLSSGSKYTPTMQSSWGLGWGYLWCCWGNGNILVYNTLTNRALELWKVLWNSSTC